MLTIIQLCSMKQKHTKYTQINTNKSTHSEMDPVSRKPNPENCKNCSSKCAYDCAQLQYTIQHRTVLIIFPLTSALRYGMHSQGISQFYLHTQHTSTNRMNHTCLCLPNRSWYSFTDAGGIEGWVGLGRLVTYRNKCPAPRTEHWHSRPSQY